MASCPDRIAVIGGGFVGLHTAVLAGVSGVGEVIVVDIDEKVVDRINRALEDPSAVHVKEEFILENIGRLRGVLRASTNYEAARGSQAYIVAVQTPLRSRRVDYSPLRSAGTMLGGIIQEGNLVVSETTIYPGGTLGILGDAIARESGLKPGSGGFLLAHAPERINPGSRDYTVKDIPRVIGGVDRESLEAAVTLYRDCFGLRVHPVDDIRVAEASKILENSYRFLNISFINELKRRLDAIGVDVRRVVEAASTKPFGYQPFYPGPGAGGSCLPKDSQMLEENLGSLLIRTAREINDTQPLYYAALILREARRRGARRILFYGVGYKPGVGYTVESPVLKVIKELETLDPGLEVKAYDPMAEGYDKTFPSEQEAVDWADMIVAWGYKPSAPEDKLVDLTRL